MKNRYAILILTALILITILPMTHSSAQEVDLKPMQTKKEQKAEQQRLAFSKLDSLVNSRQFVFQAAFDQGSDMVFVIVDSSYAEIQNGNRNNLEGRVTQCDIKKNEKNNSFSVIIKMRGVMTSADVFLFIGPWGNGRATIKADFPGDFAFDGDIVSFEDSRISEGKSHFIH